MKLNAALLFHEMQLYFQVDYMEISSKCFVKTPVFYNIFFNMDEHIVLVHGEQLEECLGRVHNAIVICLDQVESVPPVGENDLIILNDPMSSKMAFNILNHILEKFQEWETAMLDVLYRKYSFQDMVDLTGEIAGLPIALLDTNFRYIAYSKGSDIYMDKYVTSDNYLTPETIALLQKSSDFAGQEQRHEAFVMNAVEPLVCKNLFFEGTYVGRLSVILRNEVEDQEYYKALFDQAVPFMEELYAQYNSFENVSRQYRDAHRFLLSILTRQPADKRQFDEVMKTLGALEQDKWRIIVLTPGNQMSSMYSSSFICSEIEHRIPGSYVIILNEQIVALFNESLYGRRDGAECFEKWAEVLRVIHFEASVSRSFSTVTDFEKVYFAWQQAVYTEQKTGRLADSSVRFFAPYALDYLADYGGRGTIFEQICHPALIQLRGYDRLHSTSYIQTLYAYLSCNMNAVQTARTLYIHRSSFINRMQRIREMVPLELEDPDERLYLNLSFKIFGRDFGLQQNY